MHSNGFVRRMRTRAARRPAAPTLPRQPPQPRGRHLAERPALTPVWPGWVEPIRPLR